MTEVKGPGVIGKQPFLKTGENSEIHEWCASQHAVGMMGGSYQMEGGK
jgi:uncharacterized protein affecting Mg2+/Co2+ transport